MIIDNKVTTPFTTIQDLSRKPTPSEALTYTQLQALFDKDVEALRLKHNLLIDDIITKNTTYDSSISTANTNASNALSGVANAQLGLIIDNSITELKMSNEMKKDIVGGVASYDIVTSSLADGVTQLNELKQYTTLKSGKDSNSIYVTYQRKRFDGTLLMQSILSGGTSPNYTTRTETWYATNGTTVLSTKVYTITYDIDGIVVSEV